MRNNHLQFYLLNLLIFILFTGCNKEEKKSREDKFHQPLFMTLSPYISNNDFFEKTNKLNKEKKLEKGKFVLRINNENYHFNIAKNKHSISLTYSNKEEYSYNSLSYELSDSLNNKYKKILKNIKSIYDNKYVLNNKQIPFNGLYYFENMDYTLYKESHKYILLGFKFKGSRIGNEAERKKSLDKFLKDSGIKKKSENRIYKVSSDNPKITFGIKIRIDYFEKAYIDSLLVKINKDFKKSKLKEYKNEQRKEKINQRRKENINNI